MEPILLIDDDVELCSMLSDYLGRHGYQVTAEHNGKTGLGLALGGGYSIMLLDVMLPGLDGFEVLRRLRAAASQMKAGVSPTAFICSKKRCAATGMWRWF